VRPAWRSRRLRTLLSPRLDLTNTLIGE